MLLRRLCGGHNSVGRRSHDFAHFLVHEQAHVVQVKRGVMLSISLPAQAPKPQKRVLKESDAIDIWIARWLRVKRADLLSRYQCDPRRLYEIWQGEKFPASRDKALALFSERYPTLTDRIDFGKHRRISRAVPPELQPGLFDGV